MLMSRVRDWGVRPGELRVWLLIASTYIRHIGAIHPPNITKPATKLSNGTNAGYILSALLAFTRVGEVTF